MTGHNNDTRGGASRPFFMNRKEKEMSDVSDDKVRTRTGANGPMTWTYMLEMTVTAQTFASQRCVG